jgi:hypothetical protein
MTSNLPVAGVEQALSGQFAEAARATRLSDMRESSGEPWSSASRTTFEFARVLEEVMGAMQGNGAIGTRAGAEVRAERAAARRSSGTVLGDELAAALPPGAQLARALEADAPRAWMAAPMVHRAVEAYRELMNLSV